jgi:chloramphenicol 3-O-phosphotransferase
MVQTQWRSQTRNSGAVREQGSRIRPHHEIMFDLPGNILILTGTPGAGKSSTARSLVAASDAPAVHLHSDDFWHFIKKGAIPPYLPESRNQNEVVMAVLANAAEEYAKGGYFVVVDGIVGHAAWRWFWLTEFSLLRQGCSDFSRSPALLSHGDLRT